METPLILLFDGYCNLCSRTVKFVLAHDRKGKIKFTSLQSPEGLSLLRELNLPVDQFDSIVLIQGDKFYTKSSAVFYVLKELNGWPRLLTIFMILPRPVRDFIYNAVAKSRYRIFGKRDTCLYSQPPQPPVTITD